MSPLLWFLFGFLTCATIMVAALGTLYRREGDEDDIIEARKGGAL